MTVDAEICPNCNQPKPGAKGGSLTQWIFVCNCLSLKSALTEPQDEGFRFQMCRTCRKRVGSGRDGSLTQFVFRSDLCRCEKPDVQDVAIARMPGTFQKVVDFAASLSQELEIDGITLPEATFPTNRFKPIKELGRGASGAVYLCIDRLLGTRVAVKTLHYLGSEQLLSFQQEARAISRLAHPNIVRILDFGATDSGIPYMVLEYINGVNLENLLAQRQLSLSEIVDVISAVCKALAYTHSKDVFHRDLKPSNILVTDEHGFSAKLVDFGVARTKYETEPTTIFEGTAIVGTPAYMSPDQMRGATFDQRSEIYSVGCILFELLTGRQVYESDTVMEVLSKHVHARIPLVTELAPAAGYAPAVDRVIERCLAKDPNQRFQSAEELLGALESLTSVSNRESFEDTVTDNSEQSSSSTSDSFSDALYKAYREPGFANPGRVASAKKGSKIILMVISLLVLTIGIAVFLAKSPLYRAAQPTPHTVDNSADKPGVFANTLLETKYQLNEFNGGYWYFNMAPVAEESFDELIRFKKSRHLWLDSGAVSPRGWLRLKPLNLESLAIINIPIGEEDFESLRSLTTLKALRLFEIPSVTDECLEQIAKMHGLKELFLRLDNVTDNGITALSSLDQLRYLSLDRCGKLTDGCLDTIETMKKLERLSLSKTSISEAGARRVSQWKNLRVLSLSGLPCDSEIVKNLIANGVEKLSLRDTKLSREDFFRFVTAKALKQLDVRDARGITGKDVKLFHVLRKAQHLPPCRVINERHTKINFIGEMVFNTYDDEHLWIDE